MQKVLSSLLLVFLLASCSPKDKSPKAVEKLNQPIKIGIMPDAGALPLILLEDEVETVPFFSARERDMALGLGEIDGVMTDLVSLISHQQKGMILKTLSLTEGRFLIVGKSNLNLDENLRLGLSENTIIEYVTDRLTSNLSIIKVGVPQVPLRMEMLKAGKIDLACLPDAAVWPLLGAEFVIYEDQSERGIEPAVLAFREDFVENHPEQIKDLKEKWNGVVTKINDSPEDYRALLYKKLRLPLDSNNPFPMPHYKKITLPSQQGFEDVLAWYKQKYGLEKKISYQELMIE